MKKRGCVHLSRALCWWRLLASAGAGLNEGSIFKDDVPSLLLTFPITPDVSVNGEPVDALSFILHKDNAYFVGA